MSIYGPSARHGDDTRTGAQNLSGYAKTNYVDAQDGLRVLKQGDAMSGDLHMGDNLVRGLPTAYPPLYRGDEATSWAQAVGLARDAVGNLSDPSEPQHAATKSYVDERVAATRSRVDSRKPMITVWAEEKGPLSSGEYEWSFGNGSRGNRCLGYPMMAAGRVLRMGLAGFTSTTAPDAAIVNVVVNGTENTAYGVLKPDGQYTGTNTFGTPLELARGDRINFRSATTNPSVVAAVVSLLIELDL